MKTLAGLMLVAASLCLLGCPEAKKEDSAKPTTSAATSAAPAAVSAAPKAAGTGGW